MNPRPLLLALPLLAACTTQADQAADATATVPAVPTAAAAGGAAPVAPAPAVSPTDTTALLTALLTPRFPRLRVAEFKAGDINADGRPDFIVVAEQPCADEADKVSEETRCRTVLLVVNEGWPKLRIAATNDHVVDCSDCGGAGVGDPHQGVVIKGNYFSFESLYGACDKTAGFITFRYDKARRNWLLHRLGRVEYSCNDTTDAPAPETQQTSKNFGTVSFAEYNLQVI